MKKSIYRLILIGIFSNFLFYNATPVYASASSNNITLSDKNDSSYSCYAGQSGTEAADGNILTVNNSNISSAIAGNGINAANNKVYVNNSSIKFVYGGETTSNTASKDATKSANSNYIEINGADSKIQQIYGGTTWSGDANYNTIVINDGVIDRSSAAIINGGFSNNGDTIGNKIIINGGTVIGTITAGDVRIGESYNNTVILNGGTIYGTIYPSYGLYELVSYHDNKIIITGDVDLTYAQLSNGSLKKQRNNDITIDGWEGKVNSLSLTDGINFENINLESNKTVLDLVNNYDFRGAQCYLNINSFKYSQDFTPSFNYKKVILEYKDLQYDNNQVKINDDPIFNKEFITTDAKKVDIVRLGFNVVNNTTFTNINDFKESWNQRDLVIEAVKSVTSGKYIDDNGLPYGKLDDLFEIDDSIKTEAKLCAGVYASGMYDANNANIKISSNAFGEIYGGYSEQGNASNNTVTVNESGDINNIVAGYSKESGNSSDNKVCFVTGTVTESLIAGKAESGNSCNNIINLNGGTFKGVIIGGFSGNNSADSNVINIYGGDFSSCEKITAGTAEYWDCDDTGLNNPSGRYFEKSENKTSADNNTINIYGKLNSNALVLVGGVIQTNLLYNCTANGYACASQEALNGKNNTLNIYSTDNKVGTVKNFNSINFYIPATVKNGNKMLEITGSADLKDATLRAGVDTEAKLKKGDTIKLIHATSIINAKTENMKNMTEETGYNKYELGFSITDTDLLATIIKTEASENAKSPLETMAASMSMLNMGGDMLATEGLESAVAAAGAGNAESEVFAAIGNNNARVNSGSHVDVNGTTFNLGFAKSIANESGKLVIGPVVEYGTGKYDSYLDNGYHSDGKSKYWGVGLVAKQLNNTGVYYEGSLRGGRVTNDYSAADGSYDSSALYIAAHLGIGKVFKLNEKNNVDVYGKYFFTHQGGDNVEIDGNEFDFKNSNSHRARLGARYNYNINAKNTLYGGLAWQYEFSGETAGSMGEDAIESPSLKGHTGILELGWKVAPTKTFEMKLGMSAYTGVERGGSANINLNWKF